MTEGLRRLPEAAPKIRNPMAEEGPRFKVPLTGATLVITNDMVLQARRYVQSGALRGKTVEWRDDNQVGLVLRLGSKTATWHLRRKRNTFRIGSADEISINTARWLAGAAKSIDNIGSNAHLYLEKMRSVVRKGGDEAAYYYDQKCWIDDDLRLHGPDVPMPETAWTWSYLCKKFIAHKKSSLSPRWAPQFEQLLNNPAFVAIRDLPVAKIGLGELVQVKKALMEALPKSQASRALSQTRAMLDWAYAEHPLENGFDEKTYPWWSRVKIPYKAGKRYLMPSVEDLARTIVLVEHLHATGGSATRSIGAGTVGALWGVVLTGQRIGHLLPTPAGRFFDASELPTGWKVVTWTAAEMKSVLGEALPHSLPLPSEAVEILERYRMLADASGRWLFPSAVGDMPVSNAGLEGLLRRLRGIRYRVKRYPKGKGPGRTGHRTQSVRAETRRTGRDLLAEHGIEAWMPHDVRRTLSSFLDDRDLGGAGSAILSHREGRKERIKENEEERALPVTRIHYSRAQRVRLKHKGMALWVEAVLAAYRAEQARFEKALRQSGASIQLKSWRVPEIDDSVAN